MVFHIFTPAMRYKGNKTSLFVYIHTYIHTRYLTKKSINDCTGSQITQLIVSKIFISELLNMQRVLESYQYMSSQIIHVLLCNLAQPPS